MLFGLLSLQSEEVVWLQQILRRITIVIWLPRLAKFTRKHRRGCNRLIANHSASLYERPETIATHLGVHFPLKQAFSKKLPKDSKTLKIYELLKFHQKLYPSQIIQLSRLEKDTVLELVLAMHLDYQVVHNPDNSYSI